MVYVGLSFLGQPNLVPQPNKKKLKKKKKKKQTNKQTRHLSVFNWLGQPNTIAHIELKINWAYMRFRT
jgi:hypothetical protein